ncbi:MAG: hypothetical protein ACSHWZ_18730 [Sulfitobacter sp.]|uniref:hypothetical protein n=1 Tax=Celeribacter marinus TaxID=1397108 RepID=UPI00317BEE38
MTHAKGLSANMIPRRISVSSIPFFLLLCAIATTPLNTPILAVFRLNDIFLLAAFFSSVALQKLSKSLTITLLAIVLVITASILVNIASLGSLEIERLVFLYKYCVPLITAITFIATVRTDVRVKLTEKALLFGFMILLAWAYYYKAAIESGSILGVARLSFPGSSDFLVSDAHLYSNYLSLGLIFYIVHLKKTLHHHTIISTVIILSTIGALILTGSRNGIIMLGIATLVWVFLAIASTKTKVRAPSLLKGVLGSFLLVAIAFSLPPSVLEFLSNGMERALNFDFYNDASSLSRVAKFWVAVSDWKSTSLMFGASIFGASLAWYDSGLGIILVHTGLIGTFLVVGGLLFFIFKIIKILGTPSNSARVTLTILVVYIASNAITEFALVTRSALPITLFIILPTISEMLRIQKNEVHT